VTYRLFGHPLASFHMKAAVAFYDCGAPFDFELVNLGDAASRARFFAIWPIGKMPVLRDEDRGLTIPESTLIIEHLAETWPAARSLMPADPDQAREVKYWDRVYDHYVQIPMQKIVTDRRRAPGQDDPVGVEEALRTLASALDLAEGAIGEGWAVGDAFTLADCAAAPALYYADKVMPLGDAHPKLAAYAQRLQARPSFARVLREAEPYAHMFPQPRQA
jgi:glutathione S-transferase